MGHAPGWRRCMRRVVIVLGATLITAVGLAGPSRAGPPPPPVATVGMFASPYYDYCPSEDLTYTGNAADNTVVIDAVTDLGASFTLPGPSGCGHTGVATVVSEVDGPLLTAGDCHRTGGPRV